MSDPLIFGAVNRPNYQFSNEAPIGFIEDGVEWPTVDQYVRASMFYGEKYEPLKEKIRTARRPRKAKLLAEANRLHYRPDWDEVKEEIVLHALRQKFQHRDLIAKLKNTGHRPLVFEDQYDAYWSAGHGGQGKNRLGQLLEQVRDELLQQA